MNRFCHLTLLLNTSQYNRKTTGRNTAYSRELNSIYKDFRLSTNASA